eukprot:CAMPEP_0167755122 /NCGR_PEP_ID=MMETSP0110_2-20121227/8647_1 /TAXON_ID=629695 /ORGANISM="Gymnochlora sp., Strain CCMP2014" /LENGTH=315 /DNA_ID=CAMNT_0007641071 /DNA_START=206 /DNA_END=1153 /DNA_ORIENTATION=-
MLTRQIIFFPPKPPFYKVSPEGKLLRIPLQLLPKDETAPLAEDDLKLMVPVAVPNEFSMKITKVKTKRGSTIVICHLTHPRAKRGTLLHSHGNATDIGLQSYGAEQIILACRVNLVFYDYTGYGQSSGLATPRDVEADADAVYQYLIDSGVKEEDIILYGQSLGSVPTCYLARKHQVKGLVIHSGLASAIRVIRPELKKSPWFDLFRNVEVIRGAKCPAFIIHGTHDEAVPFSHGKMLYKAAPETIPAWWVRGAHHNNIELDYASEYSVRLLRAIEAFERIQRKRGKKGGDTKQSEEKRVPIVSQPKSTHAKTSL